MNPAEPSAHAAHGHARSGALAAGTCYLIWGLVPLYWKPLAPVDPVELIAHRQVWSLVLLLLLLFATEGSLRPVAASFRSARAIARLALGAGLLTVNWLVYVWGVNTGHIIETSLGYFLVPLFSVLAARFLLQETLRRVQWMAVGLAAIGVGTMILEAGRIPWFALALAGSWSWYGVLRKRSTAGAIPGLASETLLLAPFALGYLLWRHHTGAGALGRVDLKIHLLILSSGLVTAVPLLLFAHGARHIRLSTLGVLQYLAPSVQLLLGVCVYHEPFSGSRLARFVLIWVALALYTGDNLLAQRAARPGKPG
ncbi:MAG: EamA family transporter RarD [Verrucomicrobiota bacterium]